MPKSGICLALLSFATMFIPCRLSAQENPSAAKSEFYIGYGFLSNSFNTYAGFSGSPLNGWDASLTRHAAGSVSLSIAALGFYGSNLGASQIEHSVLVGPQWSSHGARESYFVHGLIGMGFINGGAIPFDRSGPSSNVTFAALAGGGINTALSQKFTWRVEADYLWSQFGSNSNQIHNLHGNFAHISTGLVLRF